MTPLNLIDVPVYDQGRRMERVLIKNQMINSGNLKPPVSILKKTQKYCGALIII